MATYLKNKLKGSSKPTAPVNQSSGSDTVFSEDEFHDASEEALPVQTFLHPDAHVDGGLAFVDKQLLESQRAAVLQLMKEAGKKLLTGHIDLVNFSVPVKMFEPRSYLQKLADVWVYPKYIAQAADTVDPVKRMRLVITWFVAGLQHVFQSWRKPFNPILGETWQAQLSDGTVMYMEQLSHHPPVTAFHMIGAGQKYVFHGTSQPDVSFKTNAIKTAAKGYRRLTFADGGCIEIEYPVYIMRGIVYTAMPRGECVGSAKFVDPANRLTCSIEFGKVEGASNPLLQRSDSFHGHVCSTDAPLQSTSFTDAASQKRRSILPRPSLSGLGNAFASLSVTRSEEQVHQTPVATCQGNWLSHLDWDGQRYWTLNDAHPDKWMPFQYPLPSDCSKRLDLQTLLSGDIAAAQEMKVELENLQRSDAKIRKAAGSLG
ncbi:hypothetical protein ABBQ38_008026 [Trebouxia sp. C0009 RCD-2024]